MRLFKYIFSIVGALTIVFCSIAQFHHHSEDGQMIVYTLNCDINNHLSQHSHNNHKNTHDKEQSCSHDCHDGHKQEDKSCALKINIVNIEKEDVNLEVKASYVTNYISTHRNCSFRSLLERSNSKMEVIVTFLVVLELIKGGKISVVQENRTDDIMINLIGEDAIDGDVNITDGSSN